MLSGKNGVEETKHSKSENKIRNTRTIPAAIFVYVFKVSRLPQEVRALNDDWARACADKIPSCSKSMLLV
jgi:hypothetical protein